MMRFESIGKRIVKAYLLFALSFSMFFMTVAIVVVEGIEMHMVERRLEEVATWASPRHAGGLPVEMPTSISFHHGDDIPQSLRNLPAGINDVEADGIGLHVFSGRDSGGPYVVVDHQSDYESVERLVYSMLLLSLMGFLGMSVLLGRYMARRFVDPIVELSRAVLERKDEWPHLDSRDELGILARAFAEHTGEQKVFLERERAFTGDVSHELRTALTVISGAAELLELDEHASPASRAASERISRAAREAAESVDTLLQLARAPELIEYELFPIEPMVQEEVRRHQSLVATKPVRLEFTGGSDFVVRAQPRLVSAIIGNLIRNACLYTDHGAVTVRLTNRSIVVCDSGRGLPAAVLAMLSNETVGAPLKGSDGTGLGLALVKRICRQLGATLDLATPPSGGTTVTVIFPGL
ncbi:HAMP domain-containing histidine kinase [Massilia sp. PAMC28688]|uniref:sensor histidine kinase n=1 Tax=Massilia sp. PAMC28688 TaxID=2861283 RepID=UPI001C63A55B|nr:HAMP domain-containing sensor histidine kinase [Massilia sp. PAMC28688]QYF93022.1 HAMP domain-containing histidine kinase [Massilia sp. PAMC28688]